MKIQLISPLPDRGFAFNAGAYWPVGLLTIGTVLRREFEEIEVEILDEALIGTEELELRLGGNIIGIQASSNLTYRHVLELAMKAKSSHDALVVLGGPYASLMARQILETRSFVDVVVSGPGEMPMVAIVKAVLQNKNPLISKRIPGVWSRGANGSLLDPLIIEPWNYEIARPLDYDLIPVRHYHENYKKCFGDTYRGSFQIFTHFGCRYRDLRRRAGRNWCTYCALGEQLVVREPHEVRDEIKEALRTTGIEKGSRLMMKCYGDNASALKGHLSQLADCLLEDSFLNEFKLNWSVYAQSSYVTPRLIEIFSRLGVEEVYVGFDSVDDNIQKINGLGTTRATHLRAAKLLKQAGIRLQAGFVLGCEGESRETLDATIQFCQELKEIGNVELFHASPFSVLGGSWAFNRLSVDMPEILATDYVEPEALQREWFSRCCPSLGSGEEGQRLVRNVADSISSMGRIRSDFG